MAYPFYITVYDMLSMQEGKAFSNLAQLSNASASNNCEREKRHVRAGEARWKR